MDKNMMANTPKSRMTEPSETTGAAIVCDLHGVITRIAYDQLGISHEAIQGTAFAEIVDLYNVGKGYRCHT
jgi:hypothetical protein